MKFQKVLLFLFILPVTLFLDLFLYALVKTCPTCGSFSQFLETEGALSFPLVVGITEWLEGLISNFRPVSKKNKL